MRPIFVDRVLHHWLVPRLEPLFEPVFVHDSFSNREGKGTHAAVQRLQQHMRSLCKAFPWLRLWFAAPEQADPAWRNPPKAPRSLADQLAWLRAQFPKATIRVQQGLARVVLPGGAQQVWVHEAGRLAGGLRQRVVVGGRSTRGRHIYSIFARRKPT